jgi:hypothetical protein
LLLGIAIYRLLAEVEIGLLASALHLNSDAKGTEVTRARVNHELKM